ncbi:signal peptidase I [Deinococcus irradiatisoli]|uniref:Signal peptidase I n=1 Tax=Deinococcus irradiatisoli TaxID=2202254 RepID=A0A2Z3JJX6_9DEIO|nr:signal peptidase I [Deinococcus irradiatisoli]AWN23871.1 signal peptidase I [Deinococcus irradiatisoli]
MNRLWREAVLPLALLWLFSTFAATIARVDGNSMNPTLHTGEVMLLLKAPRWAFAWHLTGLPYRRGDVVIFKAPPESEYAWETLNVLGLAVRHRPYIIKRVVGLPGDTVEIVNGKLRVNGKTVAESYASGDSAQDEAPTRVPPERLYVLGDNRVLAESVDSRYYGPVRVQDVAGTANIRLWPPGRVGGKLQSPSF